MSLHCDEGDPAMTPSYQTISAQLRQAAQRFEPLGWIISALTFIAIGVLDDIPRWFPYFFFWALFLGPLVALVRRSPGIAFLSAIIFGCMTIADDAHYPPISTPPLLSAVALISYSAIFWLLRTSLNAYSSHQRFKGELTQLILIVLIALPMITAILVIAQYSIVFAWIDTQTLGQNVELAVFRIFPLTIISCFLIARNGMMNDFKPD